MQENKLYVFGGDTIYIYSEKGDYLRQYQLKNDIILKAAASANRVLVVNQDKYYFLDLP